MRNGSAVYQRFQRLSFNIFFVCHPLFFCTFVFLMMTKLGVWFFVSWISSALVMFVLFYVWHGIFLNDFKRIQFPLAWFEAFAALTYLIFGAVIYFLYESELMKRIRNFFVRGIICGVIAGFSLFMIATIVN